MLFASTLPAISGGCFSSATTTPELQAILNADAAPRGISAPIWKDLKNFYAAREQKLAWVLADETTERTFAALETLRAAALHGLDPADYKEPELRQAVASLDGEEEIEGREDFIANLDVRLTASLLQLGRHVATGRLLPKSIDPRWNTRRDAPDYVAALAAANAGDVTTFLNDVQPRHPEYAALRTALASLRTDNVTDWPTVPRAPLKVGQWNATVVPPLRKRLNDGGYLPTAAGVDSPQFDAAVAEALKAFQYHHELPPTGALDRLTLDRMNVARDVRVAQVALNLERWRWLPDDLGDRHFMVNVPQFQLTAREQGESALEMRVVVGKRGNETPLFSDQMETVVFSPYWNVPDTIALEETAPAVASDPEFLSRNNMEVVNAAGNVVAPEEIPWGDEQALADFRFRQRPGANNALGYVKFLFPNKHAVYLHDTPADALFKRIGRAFSHGCVRVEYPDVLAKYVLRDQPQWTDEAIHAAMRAGEERHVKLRDTIPIYIVYMTAWVDAQGGLHFADDVYGYDARQRRQ